MTNLLNGIEHSPRGYILVIEHKEYTSKGLYINNIQKRLYSYYEHCEGGGKYKEQIAVDNLK